MEASMFVDYKLEHDVPTSTTNLFSFNLLMRSVTNVTVQMWVPQRNIINVIWKFKFNIFLYTKNTWQTLKYGFKMYLLEG